MKIVLVFCLAIFGLININTGNYTSVLIQKAGWKKYFVDKGITGTFVLTKLNSDTVKVYDVKRARIQFLPASTFKILNSLISLELRVIENENKIIKWDGKKRFYEMWNKDQNMKSAIKYSCVWFYQELARRIGKENMQYFLDTVHYGNSKLGANIDNFWLEGDLRISAFEQLNFLSDFLNHKLPFSEINTEKVKNILMVDSTSAFKFYAKSGWTGGEQNGIGWYVGFIVKKNSTWIFAINIDIKNEEQLKERKLITNNLLRAEGIIN